MPRRVVPDGISLGPYSPAVVAGNFCFVSGQAPIDAATDEPTGGDIETQTRRTLENLKAVLEAAGFGLQDVVKVNCYLRAWRERGRMNAVYAEYFPTGFPARCTVEVGEMAPGTKLEIDCIAWKQ
jgi:2-iminobutanoate/2-iminopropanoate deaminase